MSGMYTSCDEPGRTDLVAEDVSTEVASLDSVVRQRDLADRDRASSTHAMMHKGTQRLG